jgi:hypothetical protein
VLLFENDTIVLNWLYVVARDIIVIWYYQDHVKQVSAAIGSLKLVTFLV